LFFDFGHPRDGLFKALVPHQSLLLLLEALAEFENRLGR